MATSTRKTLTLTIDLEGAAFEDFGDMEVAVLLRSAAARIEQGGLAKGRDPLSAEARPLPLIESNGNTAGHVRVENLEVTR